MFQFTRILVINVINVQFWGIWSLYFMQVMFPYSWWCHPDVSPGPHVHDTRCAGDPPPIWCWPAVTIGTRETMPRYEVPSVRAGTCAQCRHHPAGSKHRQYLVLRGCRSDTTFNRKWRMLQNVTQMTHSYIFWSTERSIQIRSQHHFMSEAI